jgi:hypothetical protein
MPDTAAGLYLTEQQVTENAVIVVTGELSAPRPLFLPHSTLTYDIWCNTTVQGILVKGTSAETGLAIGVGVGAHVFSDGTHWRSTSESGGSAFTLAGDVTGNVGTNTVSAIMGVPISEAFSGGANRNVLTYNGYTINFAPVDITGENEKSALVPNDEFHIHDSVYGQNGKATLSDVESSLVSPVADSLSYRTGPGHRFSLGGPPAVVLTAIGDGASAVQDVKFESTPTGTSWRQSKRFADVANGATVSVTIGYIYVDATFSNCPRVGGILTVETSTKG